MTPLEQAVNEFKTNMYYVNAWRDDEEWEYMNKHLQRCIAEARRQEIMKCLKDTVEVMRGQ